MPPCVVKRDAKGRFAGCMPGTGGGSGGGSRGKKSGGGGGGLASEKVDDLQAIAKKEGIDIDALSYKARRSVLVNAIEAKRAGKDLREEGLLKPTKPKRTTSSVSVTKVEKKEKATDHEAIASLGADFFDQNTGDIKKLQWQLDGYSEKTRILAVKLTRAGLENKSRSRLVKEALALDKARTETRNKLTAEFEKVRTKIGETTPLTKADARKKAKQAEIEIPYPFKKKQVIDDLTDFYYLTGGQGSTGLKKIQGTSDRAYALPDEGLVNIGKGVVQPRHIWHEVGHLAELEKPEILAANQAWRSSRSSGKPEKLSELTDIEYADKEVAYKGKFIDPYVGRVYKGEDKAPTEVYSMGIENFHSPETMRDFYIKDPGHFNLILGHIINN